MILHIFFHNLLIIQYIKLLLITAIDSNKLNLKLIKVDHKVDFEQSFLFVKEVNVFTNFFGPCV